MSISRRNTLIRTVASVCGDITAGTAMAAVCIWVIESAALGLFLSFLIWLLGTLLALAVSQYVVHPTVNSLLSDRKLDLAADAFIDLAAVVHGVGAQVTDGITRYMRSSFSALTARLRTA